MLAPRLTVALSLALLGACAQTPSSVTLEQKQQSQCPLSLQVGQQFILRLPSNPTTGFRWLLRDSAPHKYCKASDLRFIPTRKTPAWWAAPGFPLGVFR